MSKGLDKFCNKYYSLVGLPFKFDGGLHLKKTNSDGTISIIDLTKNVNCERCGKAFDASGCECVL